MYLSKSSWTWFLFLALVREPTYVHSLPQLLAIIDHQLVLALFSLSLYLSFVIISISASQLLFFLWLLFYLLRSQIYYQHALLFSLPSFSCLCPLLPFSSDVKPSCMKIEYSLALQICSPSILLVLSSFPNPILDCYLLPLLFILFPC